MMNFFTVIAALSFTPLVSCDVLQLTVENFEQETAGRTVFLKFFAPWCGHCKAMASDWEQLADEWKDHAVGLVAEIDCTDEEGAPLCQEYGVEGFPTLMYGDPHAPDMYEGGRDYESLSEFAKDNISKPVCSIRNLDVCTDDEKKIIDDLKAKSKEELEKIEETVTERVEAAQATYDAALEELTAKYEQITEDFNNEIDVIREETNYKWIQQVLGEIYSKEEEANAGSDEL